MRRNDNLTIGILGNTDKGQTYYKSSQILACLITPVGSIVLYDEYCKGHVQQF